MSEKQKSGGEFYAEKVYTETWEQAISELASLPSTRLRGHPHPVRRNGAAPQDSVVERPALDGGITVKLPDKIEH